MRTRQMVALGLCALLAATILRAVDQKSMTEDQLCQRIEDCYAGIRLLERNKGNGRVIDFHAEKLSYLVLAARMHACGSERLDAILTRIQRESPTLAVPRFVITPTDLEKLITAMATDDASNRVYLDYQKKLRYMSEWIAEAKSDITKRSGFAFDRSAPVRQAQ